MAECSSWLDLHAWAELAQAIAWPVAAMAAALIFKGDIQALAARLRKGGGIELDPTPQSKAAATSVLSPETELRAATFRTPASAEFEAEVRSLPIIAQSAPGNDRETTLVALLARAALLAQFEYVDGNIWASQQRLLEALQSTPGGLDSAEIQTRFFEPAAREYPQAFAGKSFDSYMGFLEANGLVKRQGTRFAITQRGVEYLVWRVSNGRPLKVAG